MHSSPHDHWLWRIYFSVSYFSDASISSRTLTQADIFSLFSHLGCISRTRPPAPGGYASHFSHFSDASRVPGQPLRADMHLSFPTSRMHFVPLANLSGRICISFFPLLGCISRTQTTSPGGYTSLFPHFSDASPSPGPPRRPTTPTTTTKKASRPRARHIPTPTRNPHARGPGGPHHQFSIIQPTGHKFPSYVSVS